MANYSYNVSAKLKKLKKLAQDYFLLGHGVKAVSGLLVLSPEIVKEWHEEFVRSVLTEAASKRVLMRELLVKNTPQMVLILSGLAKQKGDEKLAANCASSVLSFASRFMQEDARIIAQEAKAATTVGTDRTLQKGLFDFVDPDIDGAKGADGPEAYARRTADEANLDESTIAELEAAFALLEGRERQEPGNAVEEKPSSEDEGSSNRNDLLADQPEDNPQDLDPLSGIGLFDGLDVDDFAEDGAVATDEGNFPTGGEAAADAGDSTDGDEVPATSGADGPGDGA